MELKPVREPFCLEWKISNLRHWLEEFHGQTLDTIVDLEHGLRVEFKLFKAGEMMLFFPHELMRNKGQLVIRGSDGRVFCSMEKREDVRILHFEKCKEKLGDHCTLFITLENACKELRCEYATTVLQPAPSENELEVLLGNHAMRKQRHFRSFQRRHPLNSNRDPQLVRQMISRLESLAIGQESNQPSKNDLPSTIQCSIEKGVLRVSSVMSRHERRLGPYIQRQSIYQPSSDLSTAHPTHEQLIPSLGSLSISREVKASLSCETTVED